VNDLGFPGLNLVAGWVGITLGFVTGFLLGIRFHVEDWLGGYNSFRRRMIRLAHISLFGLALINLLFYFTIHGRAETTGLDVASWGFVVGAATMPLCCLAMAASQAARTLFVIPVSSLTMGGVLTVAALLAR
jgi:hypothetical protein